MTVCHSLRDEWNRVADTKLDTLLRVGNLYMLSYAIKKIQASETQNKNEVSNKVGENDIFIAQDGEFNDELRFLLHEETVDLRNPHEVILHDLINVIEPLLSLVRKLRSYLDSFADNEILLLLHHEVMTLLSVAELEVWTADVPPGAGADPGKWVGRWMAIY